MAQETEQLLTVYCKASDYDATTGQCAAPFYGPHEGLLPNLSATDGIEISGAIIGAWAIGFMIKQGRKAASN